MSEFSEAKEFTAALKAFKQGRTDEARRRMRAWAAQAEIIIILSRLEVLPFMGASVLKPDVFCVLIARFLAEGNRERAAYHLNDLGEFFGYCGDLRAIRCYHQALKLTRDAGRRMRTLGRLGEIYAIHLRDARRAQRYYKAAILAGDRAGYNPLHVQQAHFRLAELAADAAGVSDEFAGLRRQARAMRAERSAILSSLRVPSSLEQWSAG